MDELTRNLSEARRLLRQGAYRECHAICLSVLKSQPNLAEPYIILGLLTADHQNFAKALELFERALKFGDQSGESGAHAARCLISAQPPRRSGVHGARGGESATH